MISIYTDDVEKLITGLFKKKIQQQIFNLNTDLLALLRNTTIVSEQWQRDYINAIINNRNILITNKPSELELLKPVFDVIKAPGIVSSTHYKTFRDKLLYVIGYTDRRSDFYPDFFWEVGLKSCVYCNSQLAVSVKADRYTNGRRKKTVSAKFQVDHYIPKSEYPCFSISLYNLYPVCGVCNNIKRTKNVTFQLFNENKLIPNVSKYRFALAPGCEAKYLSKLDAKEIKILFFDPDKPKMKTYAKGSMQDTFDIKGIYETQKDLAEELLWKTYTYNDSFKKRLATDFPSLFTRPSLSNRILIGNYCEPSEIHKRPMAKFVQDIARQLKMI
ncbi:MAG TPA: hypothetical protein DCO83_08440 [Mucilaginibacter sp.]|jgi:hypothetical protein|nr:hypothetical protein [Mucilaginibacter sp.]